jgi:hypothetical protein
MKVGITNIFTIQSGAIFLEERFWNVEINVSA